MQLIVKDRGAGKTHMLIQTSAITGYPIVCFGDYQAGWTKEKAELLGLDIPDPISIRQLRNENISTQMRDKVLVDDIQMILKSAIAEHLGVKEVVTAICTPFYSKNDWEKWDAAVSNNETPHLYDTILNL